MTTLNRVAERRSESPGYSLIEITVVVALLLTLYGIATPRLLTALDEGRVTGAARYMAARLYDARVEAIKRSANVSLRFELTPDGYRYTTYLDTNRNGVRTHDIQLGIDRRIRAPEGLAYHFTGVEFGTLPDLPAVEPGGPPPGTDPIRIGGSDILTFTPVGTSSPGSLYIRGANQAQYVVRVVGETGRVRILRFDKRTKQWKPL